MQADTDTVQAYLFECGDERLFAVSIDPYGRNIPRNACPEGWRLKTGFLLGIHRPVPAEIDLKAVLRGIRDAGYYVWREGMSRGIRSVARPELHVLTYVPPSAPPTPRVSCRCEG
jgi:hypothetical protein